MLQYDEQAEDRLLDFVRVCIEQLTGGSNKYELELYDMDDDTVAVLGTLDKSLVPQVFGHDSKTIRALTIIVQEAWQRYHMRVLLVFGETLDKAQRRADQVYDRRNRPQPQRRQRERPAAPRH